MQKIYLLLRKSCAKKWTNPIRRSIEKCPIRAKKFLVRWEKILQFPLKACTSYMLGKRLVNYKSNKKGPLRKCLLCSFFPIVQFCEKIKFFSGKGLRFPTTFVLWTMCSMCEGSFFPSFQVPYICCNTHAKPPFDSRPRLPSPEKKERPSETRLVRSHLESFFLLNSLLPESYMLFDTVEAFSGLCQTFLSRTKGTSPTNLERFSFNGQTEELI